MKKILIVEDNTLNVTILLKTLGDIYDVSVALNVDDAYEAMEEEMPDIFVLDIMMAGTSGLEMCKRLKSDPKTSDIPVILLTAAHDTLKDAGYEAGADDFLGKPIEGAILKSKIEALLP